VAAASGGVTIPVSSAITLTGNTTITNNQAINLSGVVSGGYGITKQGSANLFINNADTYTGSTLVKAGTLVVGGAGSLGNSPLVRIDAGAGMDVTAQTGSYSIPVGQTVQVDGAAFGNFTAGHGATISGAGTYASSVTNNGGSLVPGKLYVPSTVTFGSLFLRNASVTFDLTGPLTAGQGVNDLVAAGTLSFSGLTTLKINPLGILNTNGGQYTLFTYNTNATGLLPSSITNNLVLTDDSAYTFAFVDPAITPGSIQILASGGDRTFKVWQGGMGAAPTAWDIQTTPNWLLSASPAVFYNDD
jgi:autotransporter-associated beta strand protein